MTVYIDNPTPPTEESVKWSIRMGSEYPFDAPNSWWYVDGAEGGEPPPAESWAHVAARGIIANLSDRRGIKQELQVTQIDEDVRIEIVNTIAMIIGVAYMDFVKSQAGKFLGETKEKRRSDENS